MKILVTGGSGLVGKYIVEKLSKYHNVGNLDIVPPHRKDIPFHCVNILDFDALIKVLNGYDAVAHFAGIPTPLFDPPEKVFNTNTMGTFNVLEACRLNGIKNFIFMSSESALGFTFAKHRHSPEYIPIDELHPMRPQDAYSLSKATAEILCARYSVRTGIRTICLRSPWIWVPEQKEIELYRQLVIDFQKWYKNLWAYVHVYDLASAVLLALENTDIKGHDIFFITANENWTGLESRFLLKKYYPNIKRILKNFSGTASLISYEKAKRVLGFNPKFDVKYLLGN